MKQLLGALFLIIPFLAHAEDTSKRLNAAADVLSDVMSAPDRGIPANLLSRAQCIVIVPGLKGGAFVFGGKYGKGFFSCRKHRGWSAPAAIRIEAGSVGFQIGVIDTDLVLLVMNSKGAHHLLTDQFTLGGQGEVAGGPLGRTTTAQTDASMRAEMLSWSRSRGVFAGVSLQGSTLRQDINDNADIYGRRLRNKEIIYGNVSWPAQASELHSVLNRYSSRARRLKHRS
ncbi:MAG: lipid-binding SYLF domain-containing protein [Acidobacteriota bacterium]|nr:lipid-binding SYLF domain-containing protein [Acidobacteriota bacterium]